MPVKTGISAVDHFEKRHLFALHQSAMGAKQSSSQIGMTCPLHLNSIHFRPDRTPLSQIRRVRLGANFNTCFDQISCNYRSGLRVKEDKNIEQYLFDQT